MSFKKRLALVGLLTIAWTCIFAVTQIDLTFQVKNVLPIANGGTNASSFTASRCVQVNSGGTAFEVSSAACGIGTVPSFADAEVPSGTINGSNAAFTLAHTPSPAASLDCYENGAEQRAGGADYTLATATITYGVAPPSGTTLVCYYRY